MPPRECPKCGESMVRRHDLQHLDGMVQQVAWWECECGHSLKLQAVGNAWPEEEFIAGLCGSDVVPERSM